MPVAMNRGTRALTLNERLQEFSKVAIQVGNELDYPSELLIAQWAIESGWGVRESGTNNFFGMTKAARHGDNWKWVPTREVLTLAGIAALDPDERATITSRDRRRDGKFDIRLSRRFASYPTIIAGVLDKVHLIQNGAPYKRFFDAYRVDRNLNKLIAGFAPIYATDGNYASLVKQIAKQPNVQAAIAAARAA